MSDNDEKIVRFPGVVDIATPEAGPEDYRITQLPEDILPDDCRYMMVITGDAHGQMETRAFGFSSNIEMLGFLEMTKVVLTRVDGDYE